ncbi:polysaccharide pyruvyl transferase family protein [Candidatus Hydrogenedentota bacterium]
MRILLAGVPFGRFAMEGTNVGDEAILECAVAIFREARPGASITASARDMERTAQRLGIETCRLLGHSGDVSPADTTEIVAAHDCFVWCGATGLSDYPLATTGIMRLAQQLGKKTILWGCGMNDELNPELYKLQPGKRLKLLKTMEMASLGLFKGVAWKERRLGAQAKREIAQCLNAADLVVVRDPQSRDEVLKCGVTREVIVGADSAILMKPTTLENMLLAPGVKETLVSDAPKIGLCISAQRAIHNERELAACLDQIILETDAQIVAIPMNPLTDSVLMARLVGYMENRARMLLLTGEYQPAEIVTIASRMNVVISSRLHLLILAATVGIPIIGIARGSKVDNFLRPFGLSTVGSMDACDFDALRNELVRMLGRPDDFKQRNQRVMAELFTRLEDAKERLKQVLSE